MRGMVGGVWYRDLHKAGLAEGFTDTGFFSAIPSERFGVESGRYHLYISHACPYAHLTALVHSLCGLRDVVSMSVCDPHLGGPQGWWFRTDDLDSRYRGVTRDHLHGRRFLHEIYSAAVDDYTGRITVPVLWDRVQQTIVTNYSTAIMRIFELGMKELHTRACDLYPEALRSEIRVMSERVMNEINYGIYDAGCATTQDEYERCTRGLFEHLDGFEAELTDGRRYLLGDTLTESDLRLFVSLIRFDVAYRPVMYLSLRSIAEYPALSAYLRRVYDHPGVAETVFFDHYRCHYFDDDMFVNRTVLPNGRYIVPLGRDPL